MAPGGQFLWIAFGLLLISTWLLLRSRNMRQETGLPEGDVVYTDSGTWYRNQEVLHAAELRLVGKPDYLVKQSSGGMVPVELKSGRAPREPREGHVLQLAAYCRLVEENYGVRPEYGILQYRDKAFAIDYSIELEQDLLDLLLEMGDAAAGEELHRDHNDRGRCARCGVRQYCQQRLA